MKIHKVYSTTDVHVAGEAFRIIHHVPFIHYRSLEQLYEKFPLMYEEEKNLLLNEPRGFAGLNGCLALPPISPSADVAVLFFNHEGTVPVHYGGIVAVITSLLECGHLPSNKSGEYKIETVTGLISVTAVMEKEEVVSVKLESGPCRVIQTDVPFSHTQFNTKFSLVQADQLYAVFERRDFPFEIRVEDLSELKRWGRTVFQALDSDIPVKVAILLDDSALGEERIRSVTFRDDQFIVRSPGFGPTLACYTSLLSKGALRMEQGLVNESIFNSRLSAQAAEQTENGYQFAVTSRGFITGLQTFVLDPTDPLAAGFLLT
ncbi:putative protein/GBAA_0901/BAS0853 [Neobacillus rhizosphaerae]|uniref:Proline racemase n=1 Tax=Neobacillus rhizosphaerae TaxID=2880965 RepID=A0ABM9EQP9_9BACI|nr:proline racemase family protein [Neobacillus rhizosphaerae]CAH2714945.1 putative protein/GBAA_0901/BAS0853 [Neobacillus rhizosphaerae]